MYYAGSTSSSRAFFSKGSGSSVSAFRFSAPVAGVEVATSGFFFFLTTIEVKSFTGNGVDDEVPLLFNSLSSARAASSGADKCCSFGDCLSSSTLPGCQNTTSKETEDSAYLQC
jgi:hypothetical protein